MGVTLLESALYGTDELKKAIAKIIVENSPILSFMNFKGIQGNAYTYRREYSLPGIAFRAVGQQWTQNVGVLNPITEVLTIMGGEVFVDNFEIKTQGNVVDIKAKQFELKARAASQFFDSNFFNGDTNTTTNGFDGMRKRLTGTQLIAASGSTSDTALTINLMDQLLDAVPFDNKVNFLNRFLRRKLTQLVRVQTGSYLISISQDEYGRPNVMYAGYPLHIVEHLNDASTILDFNEDPGDAVADTASIYCISFGDEENVFGIMNGAWEVKDFGEVPQAPGHLGRIELYVGMAVSHPRAAARLYQLLKS